MLFGEFLISSEMAMTGKLPIFGQPAPLSCVTTKPLFGEKKLGVN
jgi:hypothetical protein